MKPAVVRSAASLYNFLKENWGRDFLVLYKKQKLKVLVLARSMEYGSEVTLLIRKGFLSVMNQSLFFESFTGLYEFIVDLVDFLTDAKIVISPAYINNGAITIIPDEDGVVIRTMDERLGSQEVKIPWSHFEALLGLLQAVRARVEDGLDVVSDP